MEKWRLVLYGGKKPSNDEGLKRKQHKTEPSALRHYRRTMSNGLKQYRDQNVRLPQHFASRHVIPGTVMNKDIPGCHPALCSSDTYWIVLDFFIATCIFNITMIQMSFSEAAEINRTSHEY